MAAASLMGTIDYSEATKSGELKNLYKDDEASLGAIPFFNTEQLRAPDPPVLSSFSRAPLRYGAYAESKEDEVSNNKYREKSMAPNHEQSRTKLATPTLNRKKIKAPPEINFGSFSRGDLRKRIYIKSKDEEVPNDK